MTASRKNEIIAQLVGILNELIEVDDSEEVTEISPDTVEMLTIKESTEVVKGHGFAVKTYIARPTEA